VVVVFMAAASAVAVSMGVASPAAVFTVADFMAAAISVQCQADTRSSAAEIILWVAAIGVGATGMAIGAITDSLMMSSSSATWAFRGGGAGTIRTDITVTTITHTLPMGTAGMAMGTAGMDTAGTVTTITPVIDTAMAADQGICALREIGDKRGLRCGQVNRGHSAMIVSYFCGNAGQLLLV
jgi:hypothetical protein